MRAGIVVSVTPEDRRRLKRGVFKGIVDLQAAINRYIAEQNQSPRPFQWTADPARVFAAVERGIGRNCVVCRLSATLAALSG